MSNPPKAFQITFYIQILSNLINLNLLWRCSLAFEGVWGSFFVRFHFLGVPSERQNGGCRRLPMTSLQSRISTRELPFRISGKTFLARQIYKLSCGINLIYSPEMSIRTLSVDGLKSGPPVQNQQRCTKALQNGCTVGTQLKCSCLTVFLQLM